jgi:hypothetical protein
MSHPKRLRRGRRCCRCVNSEDLCEKGLEKGRQEGRQEGQIRSQQESVLAVLETRFGEIPYALREAVTAADDLACLKRWHRLGIQLASLAEFETRMHKR